MPSIPNSTPNNRCKKSVKPTRAQSSLDPIPSSVVPSLVVVEQPHAQPCHRILELELGRVGPGTIMSFAALTQPEIAKNVEAAALLNNSCLRSAIKPDHAHMYLYILREQQIGDLVPYHKRAIFDTEEKEAAVETILGELAREIQSFVGVRMHKLGVCEWEVKLWLDSSGQENGAWSDWRTVLLDNLCDRLVNCINVLSSITGKGKAFNNTRVKRSIKVPTISNKLADMMIIHGGNMAKSQSKIDIGFHNNVM
ncbi:acetyl-CoA carboxylase 1-like [Cucumis melo var. makuwa]|uniref:Acetyl-CoA carboxylase 1-like n=1 Tax=Cucumis melo var. makuwa TaxID=1194695 RepID=A0A5A7TV25_CUCMM|nr:acetyl-CoA carboxylase 1-like [Cucumis melo var. makuwa]